MSSPSLFLLEIGLTVFFCSLSAHLPAQEVTPMFFHRVTPAENLSEATNAHVFRDSRGFVWISSVDGLNRFDGRTVRVYRPHAQKPHAMFGQNVISPLFEDREGNIWFCTYEALNCYRRRSDDFEHWQLTDPATGDTIREDYYAFFLERTGRLWLHLGYGEKGRIYCFDIQTKQYEVAGSLVGDRCVADTSAEGLLRAVYAFQYGDSSGLYRAPLLPNRHLAAPRWLEPGMVIFDLCIQSDTLVWIASKLGLIALNPQDSHRVVYAENTVIRAVEPLSNRLLALGSYGKGLLWFDRVDKKFTGSIVHRPSDQTSISDNALDGLYLDPEHNLWVSDWGYGLNFFNIGKPKCRQIRLGEGYRLRSTVDKIKAIAEDHRGQVWVATWKSGLFLCTERAPHRLVPYRPALPSNRLLGVFCDRQGVVWVATDAGLFYLEPGKKDFERVPGPLGLRVDCGWQQVSDAQILLSCDGFYSINRQPAGGYRVEKYLLHPTLDKAFCPYFYRDREGAYYCNVNYAATMVLRPDGSLQTLPLNNLTAGWEDPDGNTIWLTTTYGLAKLDKKTLSYTLYDESNGLASQYLHGIIPDAAGFLWLPSNKGILRFDPRTGHAHRLTAADGIGEDVFVPNGTLRRASGEVWMSNRDVINVFRPEDLRWVSTPPCIQITSLKVNDMDYHPAQYIGECAALEFPYSENTLSFGFVALEYSDPANNRLVYRLEGHDRDWLEAPLGAPGFARYTRLAPGHYTFQVKAANSDGVWASEPKNLRIEIRPPFWQTWWFRTTMGLLFTLAVWGGTRIYFHQQLSKQRALIEKQESLQTERNRIAGELHDDMGHGLSKIKAISEAAKQWEMPEDNRRQLDKIWMSSMELIEKMGDIIWAVDGGNDTLENLLYTIRAYLHDILETHRIAGTLDLPDAIPAFEMSGERRRNILLIIKESLHNIVKHSGATTVEARITINERLTIHIQDNGQGLVEKTPGRGGHGLRNMQKRARAAGGQVEIASSDQGVTVVLSLPLF